MIRILGIVALVVGLTLPVLSQEAGGEWLATPGHYVLNPETVSVSITARRFLMSPIRAQFHDVSGVLDISPDSGNALLVEIATADLSANGAIVESILIGESFLNAEVYPQMAFSAEGFEIVSGDYQLTGPLTMAGVTNPATFTTQLTDENDNDEGAVVLRFRAEGRLRRSNWGMTGYRGWVRERIDITIDAEFVRVEEAARPAESTTD